MNVRRRRRVGTAIVLLIGLAAPGVVAADPDPWAGKTRSDLVALLGEPSKTKQAGPDGSLLVYKLVRLKQGVAPPPSMMVLEVPGIGIAGRVISPESLGASDVILEPTTVDEQGRPVAGGVTEQQSSGVAWEDGSRTVTNSWADRSAVAGKLTLKFRLDAGGTIESWSVSPKHAVAGR